MYDGTAPTKSVSKNPCPLTVNGAEHRVLSYRRENTDPVPARPPARVRVL